MAKMNRIVFVYVDDDRLGSFYVTSLKSAKQKYSMFTQELNSNSDVSFVEWLYSIGAINNKTVFVTNDVDGLLHIMNTYFVDDAEFVGLVVDEYNCLDVRVYYDILANRNQVPIVEHITMDVMLAGLGVNEHNEFTDDRYISKAIQIKSMFDGIIGLGLIEGEEPIPVQSQ